MLTQEMLDQWREHPATRAVIAELTRQRDELVEFICTGSTINYENAMATQTQTVAAVKEIEALNKLIYMRVEGEEPYGKDEVIE